MNSPSSDHARGRARAIAVLEELTGPIGPFGSIEVREARKAELAADAPPWLLDGLLDLLAHHPSPAEAVAAWDDLELEIVDLLVALADRRDVSDRLVPLLETASARPAVIEILGALGDRRVVGDLVRIGSRAELTEDESVRLAGALGELGGDDAVALLRRMRRDAGLPASVRREAAVGLGEPLGELGELGELPAEEAAATDPAAAPPPLGPRHATD